MAYFDLSLYLKELYDEDIYEQIIASFNKPKAVCLFLNSLKCKDEDLSKELKANEIPFLKLDEYCYKIPFEFKKRLGRLKIYSLGHFYLQNYSSYLCSKNLNVKAGETVLDMCAAPGGKSINLANFMGNLGVLSCVEASKSRFFTLQENLKNYGVFNAKCFLKDAKSVGRLCPLKFDKILLDAPCSSFAKMGFELQKSQKELKSIALLQKKLLHSALQALKIKGELVYSTCTFLREENEEVIENALKSDFKLELLELNLSNTKHINGFSQDENIKTKTKRIIPDDFNQGFFIAKLKKLA